MKIALYILLGFLLLTIPLFFIAKSLSKNKKPNTKYYALAVVHGILYLWAIFLFLFAYWTMPDSGFLWWFLNDTNMYGRDHERFWKHYGKKKWWVAYVWNVKRNSHWNFRKKVMPPIKGKVIAIEAIEIYPLHPDHTELDFNDLLWYLNTPRNFQNPGVTNLKYTVKNDQEQQDYFINSSVKMTKKFWQKEFRLRQIMKGWVLNNRWIWKDRKRKLKDEYESVKAFQEKIS